MVGEWRPGARSRVLNTRAAPTRRTADWRVAPMNWSFVGFVLGILLLAPGWTSFARSESGYRACIGQYPEHCGLYFNLIKLR